MITTKQALKELIYIVTGAAIEVHKNLGPGLLESVYHKCLEHELKERELNFKSELKIPIDYKGLQIDAELRCDLFIENILVVELKAIESIIPIHEAQLLTYMKLLNAPKGLILNFNCTNISKEGQKAYVNDLYKLLPDE